MKVGLEKLESYEGIVVKALLDSRATDLFMDIALRKRVQNEKVKKPITTKECGWNSKHRRSNNALDRVQHVLQGAYRESQNGCM